MGVPKGPIDPTVTKIWYPVPAGPQDPHNKYILLSNYKKASDQKANWAYILLSNYKKASDQKAQLSTKRPN